MLNHIDRWHHDDDDDDDGDGDGDGDDDDGVDDYDVIIS